jgi:hypothetical protein
MTGRVVQLPIEFWSETDLLGIPRSGFAALNVEDPDETLSRTLAAESFSSPFLMQDFCLQLVKANGVREATESATRLQPPADWDTFFRSQASAASKAAFDLLAQGPRQRADRKERTLKDGRVTDIYGAVLEAIAYTGPLTQLRYIDLRAALREVLRDEPPTQPNVIRVLQEMSKIAREDPATSCRSRTQRPVVLPAGLRARSDGSTREKAAGIVRGCALDRSWVVGSTSIAPTASA